MSLFTIRASSFGELLDCAHRWEGKYILGMRGTTSGAAHLGTSLHAGTAVFDQSRVERAGLTASDAAGVFVDTLRHPPEPVQWGDQSIKDAERIGLSLTTRYCNEVSPRYEFRAVEMETLALDIEAEGVTIRLTGRMDRARIKAGGTGVGIADVKSGKRAVDKHGNANTAGHWPQLGVYELLYEHTTKETITEPAEIVALQTSSSNPRIGTAEIKNARALLVGQPGEMGVIEMVARKLKAGMFEPNPRSVLCSEKWCARWSACKYHP